MRGYSGTIPTQAELAAWATEYGMTFPVLSIDFSSLTSIFGNSIGTPSEALLAPGMQVSAAGGSVSEAQIIAALPGA